MLECEFQFFFALANRIECVVFANSAQGKTPFMLAGTHKVMRYKGLHHQNKWRST